MPRVTVVTAAYNASGYIAETIESVLRQSYQDFDFIVVDDGSSDTTAEVVRRFEPRVTLIQQPNTGAGGARNAGFEVATGEYIAIVDADDLWSPDKLGQQVELMDAHPDAGLCYTDCSSIDEHGSPLKRSMIAAHPPLTCLALLTSFNPIVTSSVLYRRRFLEARPFRLDLAPAEDFHVHLKVLWRSEAAGMFMDKPLVQYRMWSGSIMRRTGEWERGRIGLKTVDAFVDDMGVEKPLPLSMARKARAYAYYLWAWVCIESNERSGFALKALVRATAMNPMLACLALKQVAKLSASRLGLLKGPRQ